MCKGLKMRMVQSWSNFPEKMKKETAVTFEPLDRHPNPCGSRQAWAI